MSTTAIHLLAPAHAPAIQRLASDREVAATTRLPHPYPDGGASAFIQHAMRVHEQGSAHHFAIEHGGAVVGACGIERKADRNDFELGYWVGRPYWRQGHATVAVKLLLEFAFATLDLAHLFAAPLESNGASRQVLEKNGFILRALQAHNDASLKSQERIAIYDLSRAEWLNARHAS